MMPKNTTDEAALQKIDSTLAHFPEDISKDIHDYVINDVLLESRYIFTTRKNDKQFGFCTHCKNEFEPVYRLKHKTKTMCPNCNSKCKVQAAGYSRKYMVDEAYFVFYEKSKINKEAVIARGFTVCMDFSGDYKSAKPKFNIEARYLFEMGNPVFIKTYYSWPDRPVNYELRKSVFSLYKKAGYFGVPVELNQRVSIQSIKEAVKGTQFQYSEWHQFSEAVLEDYVSYFALYAKHPQIEYLMKLGFKEFVQRKLFNETTYRTINWNGKTIDKVLRVNKQDAKEIISYKGYVAPFTLAVYQIGKADGSNITMEEAAEMESNFLAYEFADIKRMLQITTLRRLFNYLKRQMIKMNSGAEAEIQETDPMGAIQDVYDQRAIFIMLKDYQSGCRELGLQIGDDIPAFPGNLTRAHDNIYKQISYKKNKELDNEIKKRLEKLKKYKFETEHYFIRPLESSYEVIQEGKELKHCVGGYAKRYAKGETDLFAIRSKAEPNTPYCTLEMKDGEIRQYYGYRNRKNNEMIEFVEEFKANVLNDKKELVS